LKGTGHKPTGRASAFNLIPAVYCSSISVRSWLRLLAAAAALWLVGCGDSRLSPTAETDEPYYREGDSLMRSGRRQEALTAFLKVIDKRGEDAPESHLNAGLIYQQYINDPLSAIYHFKKYLVLRSNSPQAPLVRQRIDAAIREFARTLPAQPLEGTEQRVDLVAALDQLKQENEQLKQQIADLRAGREPTEPPLPSGGVPVTAKPSDQTRFTLNFETIPTVRVPPSRPEPTPVAKSLPSQAAKSVPSVSSRPSQQPATSPAAHGAARKHAVQRGDTLSNLAQKYYGNRARWHDIYNANRKVMKNEGDLRAGMELVIPP
jgi:tetratricopeptide (TPR) repeat protein